MHHGGVVVASRASGTRGRDGSGDPQKALAPLCDGDLIGKTFSRVYAPVDLR
jgi:hypothetical protein